VQYIYKVYRRSGTPWDSRYKSSLVQTEGCSVLCERYVELNPGRAAMVEDPAHYRWTSYRHHALGRPRAEVSGGGTASGWGELGL
jgi:putative transposase